MLSSQGDYNSRTRAAEEAKLKAMVDSLTEEDREKVYQRGLLLESAQNQVEDVSCLPSVGVSGESRLSWEQLVGLRLGNGLYHFFL